MSAARRPERPRYDPHDPLPNIQRVPPQAAEAEAQVLAGILLYPDGMGLVRGRLSAGDFYTEAHRAIYRAACVVEDSGQGVDRVMVAQTLDEQGFADLAGGRAYLAALVKQAPLKTRLCKYAEEIRKAASLRELIEAGGQIIGMAHDREHPADKILEDAQELVALVRARGVGPAGLETMTAAELAVRSVPETAWILPEVLRDGLTLFGGKSKIGKSWFVYQIGLWVAMGWDPISNLPMPPRDALYLALEDDDRRLKSRLLQLLNGDSPPERLHLGMACPTLDHGAAARICGFLDDHPDTGLVIVDTFARVRGVPDPRGNAYYQDYDVLARLQKVALDRRFALVLVHHLNKVDHDDPFDSLSGSTGMQGPTDGMMVLQRLRQESTAQLQITGRGVPDRRLKMEWADRTGWAIVGDVEACDRSDAEVEVLEALAEKGAPMSPAGLAQELGKKRPSMCRHLKKMEARGLISSTGGWYQPTATGLAALGGSG